MPKLQGLAQRGLRKLGVSQTDIETKFGIFSFNSLNKTMNSGDT